MSGKGFATGGSTQDDKKEQVTKCEVFRAVKIQVAWIFMLKMEAAWTFETLGILPQNYMASQRRRPRKTTSVN
jgi:hypothetical protein